MKNSAIAWIIVAIVIIVALVYFIPGSNDSKTNQESPQITETTENTQASEQTETSENMETEETSSFIDVSAAKAKELIDNNPELIIIDVSPHYAQGHLPGAVNYYLGDGSLDAAIPTLDKEAIYLVYCHVDSVAISGAQKLIDAGFMNVYRLEGNYAAWVEAGYSVEM